MGMQGFPQWLARCFVQLPSECSFIRPMHGLCTLFGGGRTFRLSCGRFKLTVRKAYRKLPDCIVAACGAHLKGNGATIRKYFDPLWLGAKLSKLPAVGWVSGSIPGVWGLASRRRIFAITISRSGRPHSCIPGNCCLTGSHWLTLGPCTVGELDFHCFSSVQLPNLAPIIQPSFLSALYPPFPPY